MLTIIYSTQFTGMVNAQGSQVSDTGKSPDVMVISGLPGFQALAYGKNVLSIAVLPVSSRTIK